MDSSPQSSLLKSLGAYGGKRVTGSSLNTGVYMAVKALTDTTILNSTVGNIDGITGAIIIQGDTLLGQFSVLGLSGDSIIYKL
tara:strand:+ start:481 stop:729 length:249 start_codon:yes stop_codon:yes gene_type:complete